MRYIEEINGKRKGVFLVNLDYKRKSYHQFVKTIYRNAINEQLKGVFEKINSANSLEEIEAINMGLDSSIIKKTMLKTYEIVGSAFAKETVQNLVGVKKDITVEDKYTLIMRNFIEKYGAERITWITHTTKENYIKICKNIVQNAIKDGISITDTRKAIMKSIGYDTVYRAERIARTEIVSASNRGSLEGAKSTGLNINKVWIAKMTNRTRHSHKELDGQVVGINEPFMANIYINDDENRKEGKEKLYYPGDINGSAGNVINCSCTQGYKRIL
jgi:hypothetical protein